MIAKKRVLPALIALLLAGGASVANACYWDYEGYGYGMGPGMMYGPGWMGPGMMYGNGSRGGYGAGRWGPPQQANLNLTVDQVRNNMQRWLETTANPHIKLGNVAAKDADTIAVDIVTTDKNVLVQRYEINRHTGFAQQAR